MIGAAGSTWLKHAKKNAGWLIALGLIEIVVGIMVLGSPLMAGIAIAWLVGLMLIAVGIARLIEAFKAGSFGAGALGFLSGLFAIIVGGYMSFNLGAALATLTLVLAIYLFVDGVQHLLLGFKLKPAPGSGWMVFGGIVSILLAVLIWRRWPLSGEWAIGTLVGIHLLISGWTMMAIGLVARKGTAALQDSADSD
jgi:uncharacterized membrane protein HdeD (DUF308 family)